MRNKLADIIYKTGSKNKKIFILVADISPAGSMSKFREKYPNRFINTGVAEQSMIGIAAGMALRGFKPFCYTEALATKLDKISIDDNLVSNGDANNNKPTDSIRRKTRRRLIKSFCNNHIKKCYRQ